jgi:hypothetical protein
MADTSSVFSMRGYRLNLLERVIGKFRKKNELPTQTIDDIYQIEGLTNYDKHPVYSGPEAFPNFRVELERFKSVIQDTHTRGRAASFYKFGDGDYYFLRGLSKGSAKPGNRALSKPLSETDLKTFQDNSTGSDFYMCELYPENVAKFQEVFPAKLIDFPAEFSYICIASNWFIRSFKNIGVIGADEKISLIKKLSEKSEYKDSLGFDGFTSYISVPQKFSCDDLDHQLDSLRRQLNDSSSDIFLVGVGHLKSGVLGELKKYKKAIYVDVGSGIDALAGIIDTERPYFGAWTNFQLKDFDYGRMDYLGFNGKNIKIIN